MVFPNTIFGKCPRCGAGSGDDATPNSAGGTANSESDIVVAGNGLPLSYYLGDLLCELCIKEVKADNESLISADKHKLEEEFRDKAGFKTTIP